MANTRRQPATVNASEVSSALTDFPVHIPRALLADEVCDPSGSNNAQADGGDLRWYSDEGVTRQALEVVAFGHDTTTGAGDADVELHGLAPSLSAVVDTTLYLEYDSDTTDSQPAASDTYGSENVWDSNYKAVWHFNSDSSLVDSTSNNVDGSMVSDPALVGAAVGNGLELDSDDRIDLSSGTNILGLTSEYTSEAVFNATAGDDVRLLDLGCRSGASAEANTGLWLYVTGGEPVPRIETEMTGGFDGGTRGRWNTGLSIATGDNALALRRNTAGASCDLWSSSGYTSNSISTSLSSFTFENRRNSIGAGTSSFADNDFSYSSSGVVLDELRVSDIDRSDAWIAATDSTLLTPATFASAGTPVSAASAGRSLINDGLVNSGLVNRGLAG